MAVWMNPPDLDQLNGMSEDTLVQALGIRFTEAGEDYLRGSMPVDARTHQPYGILHGGASVALAETLGSSAAMCCIDPASAVAVGLDINANHVRAVRAGTVTGTARPVHLGRTTQVWEIRIEDGSGQLACIARLTMAVVPRRAIGA